MLSHELACTLYILLGSALYQPAHEECNELSPENEGETAKFKVSKWETKVKVHSNPSCIKHQTLISRAAWAGLIVGNVQSV